MQKSPINPNCIVSKSINNKNDNKIRNNTDDEE